MKPITKLYLKTFLLTGIPYALIMLGFDLAEGTGFSLWKFIFMTFFFGITWKSWGEKIKIVLKSEKNTDFEYQVSSSPKLKTTLVDYGKNLQNVNRILSLVKNIA